MTAGDIVRVPEFCEPEACPIVGGRTRRYRTPEGNLYPSVTTILKALGLGTEALIAWSAREERKAVLEACAETYAEGVEGGPAEFAAMVEERIGKAKQHQKLIAVASEIGSQVHREVQRKTRMLLGQDVGPAEPLVEQAQWAVMSWEDWLKDSGLKLYRCEQPVWDDVLKSAGTVDVLAYDERNRLGIVDYKTSKGIYDSHHIQVAAYCHLARNFADIEWAKIVRFPKNLEDPAFEVKELGDLYDRRLTEDQLLNCFRGATMAWRALNDKEAA